MLPALLLALVALILAGIPRALLRRYLATFRTRHGLDVQVGLAVLATATIAMVIATLLDGGPDENVSAVVVAGLAVAGFVDLALFSRRYRR